MIKQVMKKTGYILSALVLSTAAFVGVVSAQYNPGWGLMYCYGPYCIDNCTAAAMCYYSDGHTEYFEGYADFCCS
jgi:hypothetical protein